jgi:hypothetical protein
MITSLFGTFPSAKNAAKRVGVLWRSSPEAKHSQQTVSGSQKSTSHLAKRGYGKAVPVIGLKDSNNAKWGFGDLRVIRDHLIIHEEATGGLSRVVR